MRVVCMECAKTRVDGVCATGASMAHSVMTTVPVDATEIALLGILLATFSNFQSRDQRIDPRSRRRIFS